MCPLSSSLNLEAMKNQADEQPKAAMCFSWSEVGIWHTTGSCSPPVCLGPPSTCPPPPQNLIPHNPSALISSHPLPTPSDLHTGQVQLSWYIGPDLCCHGGWVQPLQAGTSQCTSAATVHDDAHALMAFFQFALTQHNLCSHSQKPE